MNLFENKRAAALTGVFTLAFAGLMAYGFSVSSTAGDLIKEGEEARKALKSKTEATLPPDKATVAALNSATKSLAEQVTALKKELVPYVKTCKKLTVDSTKNKEVFGPKHLESARSWLDKKSNGCTRPGGDGFTFGLDRNFNERQDAANEYTTPFLLFQLNAARTLAGYIADSGAVSIDRMYCEPVPTEEDGARTALHIEIGFTAKRGAIPPDAKEFNTPFTKVLNAIQEGNGVIVSREGKIDEGNDKAPVKYFFVIKGITAVANGNYEDKDEKYEAPAQVAGSESTEITETIAKLVVGNPEDTVRYNLVVEAVYFSPSEN
ncbi:MAG: hypothetical protein E7031_07755 [Akkermansiaceae bacterium]|nr:hypothetical protein [Akkermansiaceae bacterium]